MKAMKIGGYIVLLVLLGLFAGGFADAHVYGDPPAHMEEARVLFWLVFTGVLGLGLFVADRIL